MKFGVPIPIGRIDPKGEFQSGIAVREFALAAERSNLSGVCISEHPAPDAQWLHNDPTGHDALDPFTALAFVAAATTRLIVVTNVVVLPYRNPFITAKAGATLQVLSDGRFILGAGVGYQKAEFEALGAEYRERGLLMEEALQTIRLAWKGGEVVMKGRTFNAPGNEPRPIPSPVPPIWIGGGSEKALDRAARLGDGWTPYFTIPTNEPELRRISVVSMEHFAEKVSRLKELRERLGKTEFFDYAPISPFRPMTTTSADAERLIEAADQVYATGATWLWTHLPTPSRAGFIENMQWFSEEVVAKFNKSHKG